MNIKRKYYQILLLVVIVIFSLALVIIKIKLKENKDEIVTDEEIINTKTHEDDLTTCMIDIKGAVNNPGVYTTNCTDNVSDIIRLAGGLTEDADTSVTNLAKKVTNEMVIIIYTKEEVKNSNVVDTVVKVVEQECVCPNIKNDGCINNEITDTIGTKLININTASIDELKTIPGIGEAKAKAIINYRNTFGSFKKIEDIQNVDGIGSKLFEEIKAYITA